jgi:transcriptional regulator with XRE-family HTH domain
MEGHRQAVGQRLLALRKAKSWSQEDAAHKVGVSVSTWGDWERGKHTPYDANWRKIEQAFEIDATEIRGEPPAPLFGVGSESRRNDLRQQLARIEAKIDEVLAQQRAHTEMPDVPRPPSANKPSTLTPRRAS